MYPEYFFLMLPVGTKIRLSKLAESLGMNMSSYMRLIVTEKINEAKKGKNGKS